MNLKEFMHGLIRKAEEAGLVRPMNPTLVRDLKRAGAGEIRKTRAVTGFTDGVTVEEMPLVLAGLWLAEATARNMRCLSRIWRHIDIRGDVVLCEKFQLLYPFGVQPGRPMNTIRKQLDYLRNLRTAFRAAVRAIRAALAAGIRAAAERLSLRLLDAEPQPLARFDVHVRDGPPRGTELIGYRLAVLGP